MEHDILFGFVKATIGKSFVEIETENPYFDGNIYPNKYNYVKKHPENVIMKTV